MNRMIENQSKMNPTHTTRRGARWLVAAVVLSATVCLTTNAGILAYWNFNESGGTTVHDSAGPFEGALSSTGAAFVPGGISGNAISLLAVDNGFVNFGDVLGLTSGDFSIVAWVKTAAGDMTQNSLVLSKHLSGFNNGYFLNLNRSGILGEDGKAMFFAGDQFQTAVSTTSVNDGDWHQVVVVYKSGGSTSIYVDGAPAESSVPSQPIQFSPAPVLIGGATFDEPRGLFTGLIDEVQIYDQALTDADVDFLFHNPTQTVEDCATQKARIDTQIQRLTADFRQVFNRPEFRIAGESTADQVETLVNAILNLNLGEKQGLYFNLGGQRPPN